MKNAKTIVLLLVVAVLAAGLWWWWGYRERYPSTDDAYLQANILTVAPKVSGTVAEVLVKENQKVSQNDVLFRLDGKAMKYAVDQAEAQLAIAMQNAGSAGDNVSAAAAQLAGAEAALQDAEAELERNGQLLERGIVTRAVVDQMKTARDGAQAKVDAARAALSAARNQAGGEGSDNASVKAARAALAQASLNLADTTITAPADGWIANIALRPGQFVSAGQPLFSVVEDGEWWIEANFKETDLGRIRPGQKVQIDIDMYPGTELEGTVQSIGTGSGAVFSLLPPQNATGNWVKVTQRFPVLIRLDTRPGNADQQLRVGASVTATVDTEAIQGK